MGACGDLAVVEDADMLAFGFATENKELCAALHPCSHLYAIAQTGISTEVLVGGLITMELNAPLLSLNPELVLTNANSLWSGGMMRSRPWRRTGTRISTEPETCKWHLARMFMPTSNWHLDF